MPAKKKANKIPFDTDIIMPGRKYPKKFNKQMQEMRKATKKKAK